MTETSSPAFDAATASAFMIPMLPCDDVEAMAEVWTALGLEVTYRQLRPNPFIALERGGIALQYYGMPGWDPEQSHSTCGIVVADTRPVYERFAVGLRDLFGKVPVSGAPRLTRPRERANNGGLSGFSLIDPAGNWVRVNRAPAGRIEAKSDSYDWVSQGGSPLARAVENAVVLADSHGDVPQARKVLTGALRRAAAETPAGDRARALAYLVELAVRSDDVAAGRELLADLDALAAGATEDAQISAAVAEAREVLPA